jgi:PAS domain S-box-containing protein
VRLRAHQLFTTLAENVRDYALFLMDADGIIRYWGEGARLMKWWTKDEAEGAHLRLLYPDGGSEDGTAEAHLQTAAERGEYTGEGLRIRGDGATFRAGVTLTALTDEDGALLGFVKMTRDFSARRAVEAALKAGEEAAGAQRVAEEANRLKTVFIATVSHEIRSPLTAIIGYAQLLDREQSADQERQRSHIRRILRSSRHLMQVVDDVLDLTRLEEGRVQVNSADVLLGEAITSALSDVQPQTLAKGVRLSDAVSGGAADISCWGDSVRVRQIIVNLLSNAVKFTPQGGTVTVSAGSVESAADAKVSGKGPWAYVRVEDTGPGIPAERLDRIFEPFEQVRTSDADRGSGLGLSISRRFARAMGGDLTVRSEVSVGSEFTLWLPVTASDHVPR